ncbi:CRISPR-associated protein Cas4, subtype PREFRAN [Porphyromonas crevioricanis]|nr:CRISPR-associated protein Cas4, subtype PREFRAN [Porphyromonas crevioricanis]
MATVCAREILRERLMDDYILISTLNDFIFCPYSIYLHNVYMSMDKDLYHAAPQLRGTLAHGATDDRSSSTRKDVILALPICSERFHLIGKIDVYRQREKKLIERKYQLKQIFQGQIYQLWAQFFCMKEMGYEVESIAFYEMSTNKMRPIPLPSSDEELEFEAFIARFLNYDPSEPIITNPNKCKHCIYCNLCDKTDVENVYS